MANPYCFIPWQTLFISEDGTYPGIVEEVDTNGMVRVHWFKWGFGREPMVSFMTRQDAWNLIATPDQIRQQFKGLPRSWYGARIATPAIIMSVMHQIALLHDEREPDPAFPTLVNFTLEKDGSWGISIETMDLDSEPMEIITDDNLGNFHAFIAAVQRWFVSEDADD